MLHSGWYTKNYFILFAFDSFMCVLINLKLQAAEKHMQFIYNEAVTSLL